MTGIGFEIESPEPLQLKKLDKDEYVIRIYYPEDIIFAEAIKVWSFVVEEEDGKDILKGGLALKGLSSENREKQSRFLEIIRNREGMIGVY